HPAAGRTIPRRPGGERPAGARELTTLRTGSNTRCDLRAQAPGRHDAWLADRQIRTSGDPPAQAQPDRNLRGVLPGHGHTPSVRFTPNCRGRHPTVQLSGRRVNGLRTRPEEEGTCRDHLVSTNCRGATGPSAGPGSSTTSRCWTT